MKCRLFAMTIVTALIMHSGVSRADMGEMGGNPAQPPQNYPQSQFQPGPSMQPPGGAMTDAPKTPYDLMMGDQPSAGANAQGGAVQPGGKASSSGNSPYDLMLPSETVQSSKHEPQPNGTETMQNVPQQNDQMPAEYKKLRPPTQVPGGGLPQH